MKYLPIISRFIGGSDNNQLLSTIKYKLTPNSWLPIIDLAKESSITQKDVEKYKNKLHNTLSFMNNNNVTYSLALKLSSYLPYEPEKNIRSTIDHAFMNGCKYIYLDAETDDLFKKENDIFNEIIKDYNNANKTIKIYKTYQMYKNNSFKHLINDINNLNYLGIKLVRGAYYYKEQEINPHILFKTKLETDNNYNNAIDFIIRAIHCHNIKVLIATHNNISVNKTIELINPNSNKQYISFAQLLGMNDELSNYTSKQGLETYKYVPYGTMQETLPYLIRRLYENYDIIKYVSPGLPKLQ